MSKEQKRFIIKKYVIATSPQDALRKEKKQPADEVVTDSSFGVETNAMGY